MDLAEHLTRRLLQVLRVRQGRVQPRLQVACDQQAGTRPCDSVPNPHVHSPSAGHTTPTPSQAQDGLDDLKRHRTAVFHRWAEEENITPAGQAARALRLTQEVETQMRSEFESINGQFDRVFNLLGDGPSTGSRRPSARSSSPSRGIATAPAPAAGYAAARSSTGQGAPAVPPPAPPPPAGPAAEYAAAYVAAHVRAPPPLPAMTPSEVSPASAAPRTVRVAFGAPLPPGLMAQPPAVAQPPAEWQPASTPSSVQGGELPPWRG